MSFRANPTFTNALPSETQEAVRTMFGQLPIVFALRAGGELRIPASEIDATGGYLLSMEVVGRDFIFKASKKQ